LSIFRIATSGKAIKKHIEEYMIEQEYKNKQGYENIRKPKPMGGIKKYYQRLVKTLKR